MQSVKGVGVGEGDMVGAGVVAGGVGAGVGALVVGRVGGWVCGVGGFGWEQWGLGVGD